jgi:hypothetical protein
MINATNIAIGAGLGVVVAFGTQTLPFCQVEEPYISGARIEFESVNSTYAVVSTIEFNDHEFYSAVSDFYSDFAAQQISSDADMPKISTSELWDYFA